jgi:hypothetical protein
MKGSRIEKGMGGKQRMREIRRLIAYLLLTATLLAGCAGSREPGSREDLARRLDGMAVPGAMVEVGELYQKDCGITCPLLVRWYNIPGSLEGARSALLSELDAAGRQPEPNDIEPNLIVLKENGHVTFIHFRNSRAWSGDNIPSYVDADISVRPIPDV